MQTDNKGQNETLISRLSKMQKTILAVLAGMPADKAACTGDIIDALSRERTASNYAAISKALRRLEERRLVSSCASSMAFRGKGLRYHLTRGEQTSGRTPRTVPVPSRSRPTKIYRNHMTIDARA
jgi:hypothetical protein